MKAIWNNTVLAESDDIVTVEGNAVWYYPEPKAAAAEIRDRVAFWKGVQVTA